MSLRAAPGVGSAPTEPWTHLLGPCPVVRPGPPSRPLLHLRAAVAKGPRGRAGVQSRAGKSSLAQPPVLEHMASGPIPLRSLWLGPEGQPGPACPPGPVCLSSRQGGRHLLGVLAARCPGQRSLMPLYGEPSAPKGTASLLGASS